MKLIDKNKLLEELKKLKHNLSASPIVVIEDIESLVESLEVKEVDLNFEIKEDWLFSDKTEVDCLECMCLTEDMFVSLAKKYFKLGLKAQKGE